LHMMAPASQCGIDCENDAVVVSVCNLRFLMRKKVDRRVA
jgi:hypothetical protein